MARTLLILCVAAANLAAKDRAWQTGQMLDKTVNPYFRTLPASAGGGNRVSSNSSFVAGDNGVLATNTRAADGDVSYENYVFASADTVYLLEFAHFKTFPLPNLSLSKPVTFAVEKNKVYIMDLDRREFETTILKQTDKNQNATALASAEQPGTSPADQAKAAQAKVEQAKAELAKAEQAKAEQAKAEQARIAQAKAEQARIAQEKFEQVRAEQARIAQEKADQAKAEQARIAQEKAEQAKADQIRMAQVKAEQARIVQEKAEQAKAEQARLALAKAEQAKVDQARAEQARLAQAKADQAKAEQAKVDQANADQARAEQARLAQAKADQAKAEQAKADQARAAEQARLAQERAEKPKSAKPDNVFATAALTNAPPPKPAPSLEASVTKPVQRPQAESKPEGPVVRASSKDRAWQSGQLLSVPTNNYFFNVTYTSDVEGTTWPFSQGSDGRLTVTGQIPNGTNSPYTYDNYVIESQFVVYLVERMRPKTSPPVPFPGTHPLKFAVDKGKMWVLDEKGIEYETKVVKLIQKDAIVDPLTRAATR